MNFIFDPTIYLVGEQSIVNLAYDNNIKGLGKFLSDHNVSWETDGNPGESICETAGRVCYMSFAKPRPGGNKTYLEHILEVGHGSVLEHAVWNFIITGVSRSFSHELVRHRAGWGYSQLSQRYVDASDTNFIVPQRLAKSVQLAFEFCQENGRPITKESLSGLIGLIVSSTIKHPGEATLIGLEWLYDCVYLSDRYKRYTDHLFNEIKTEFYLKHDPSAFNTIDEWWVQQPQELKTTIRKEARQTARSILPNATETKIFCTANARAIRHFIEMRASRHAEAEIRKVAYQLWQVMMVSAPNIFRDYTPELLHDGTYELTTKNRKV